MDSRTEVRHGMRVTWHQYPVVLSHGVYAKGLAYQDGYPMQWQKMLSEFARTFHDGTRGTGGMTHDDPINRPRDVFGGTVTLHAGGGRESYLLAPIVPAMPSPLA